MKGGKKRERKINIPSPLVLDMGSLRCFPDLFSGLLDHQNIYQHLCSLTTWSLPIVSIPLLCSFGRDFISNTLSNLTAIYEQLKPLPKILCLKTAASRFAEMENHQHLMHSHTHTFFCLVYSDFNFKRLKIKNRVFYLFSDNKDYDVFVCYDQMDAEFALGVLVHILENVYHYHCFVYERDSVAGDCKYRTIV
jgi:hypothetical protein